MAALLRRMRTTPDPKEASNIRDRFSGLVEAIRFFPAIPPRIELLLVKALVVKDAGYYPNELLTERGLSPIGVKALGRELREIARKIGGEKADLYYLVEQVKIHGNKIPDLFESACALMRSSNSDNGYSAGEILKTIELSPAQISVLVTELNSSVPESALKDSATSAAGRIAQALEQADPKLISGARDGLIKMILRGVDAFYAEKLLEKIGIRNSDRVILEAALLRTPKGDSTYYLARAAKLPIVAG
jgi:hypothetical protein